MRVPGCSSGRISSTGRPCSDTRLDLLQRPAEPRRGEAEGRGRRRPPPSPPASTCRASVAPTPCWNGSPEASTQTARPRSASTAAIAGVERARPGRAPRRGSAAAASARWRRAAEHHLGARDQPARAAAPSPSTPSSPIPTTASHFAFACAAAGPLDGRHGRPHVLILGGTGEARALAERPRRPRRASASPSRSPAAPATRRSPPARVRVGGFGGADGLAAWLAARARRRARRRHPPLRPHDLAPTPRAAAARRRRAAGRRSRARPGSRSPATAGPRVPDMAGAGARARRRRRAASSSPSAARRSPPSAPRRSTTTSSAASSRADPADLPPGAETLLARGPFAEADERALLEARRIEVVVAKNSGGDATYGKIAAARALGLPVVMVDRPPAPTAADARRGAARSLISPPSPQRGV